MHVPLKLPLICLPWRHVVAGALLAALGGLAWAQQGIYTCIDSNGRRLTSDRPIVACLDREQHELSSSGTIKRVIPPTLTQAEREARQERERQAELERQRALDLLRRDQALVLRYPDKAAHDATRREALEQTQTVIEAAEHRLVELGQERKTLDQEMEFYRKDPAKAPFKVRRGIEDNALAEQQQRRAIAAQQAERDRINGLFDEELKRLRALWEAAASNRAASPRPR